MVKRRLKFTMEFEVDLDPVPGFGHQPIDWIKRAQDAFISGTYRDSTKAKLVGDTIEVSGYTTTNFGDPEDMRAFYDPKMTAENIKADVHVHNWFDHDPDWDGIKFPIERPWIVTFADASVEAYGDEDMACYRQRQWRRETGRDEMTGELVTPT
jgi:hypothetical protein